MAGEVDCLDQPQDAEAVLVALDSGMMKALETYCESIGIADRGDAINELLMIGLSVSMPDPGSADC